MNCINLSLGSQDEGDPNNAVRVMCREAIKRGIWVVAAAGNSGPTPGTIMNPACERYVIATGSIKYLPEQNSFVVSDFSSRGPTKEGLDKPDGVLFGEDLIMASSESNTATTYKSGTSFACPFGAAMALLYLEGVKRNAITKQSLGELPPGIVFYVPPELVVDNYFPRMCLKPSNAPTGKDNEYGYGLPYGPLVMQVVKSLQGSSLVNSIYPLLFLIMIGTTFANLSKLISKN